MAIGLKPGYCSIVERSLAELAGHAAEERLEVAGLGNRRVDRMIGRLPAGLQDLHEAAGVPPRELDGTHQVLRGEVIGAGAGHQQAIAVDELEGELIELAIGGLPLRNIFLALDERRWVEDYDIEACPLGIERLESFE